MTDDSSSKLSELKVADSASAATKPEDEDVVDPWNVASTADTGVNYDKLIGIENRFQNCVLFIFLFVLNVMMMMMIFHSNQTSSIWIVENRRRALEAYGANRRPTIASLYPTRNILLSSV